jgi:3',5'-cyclic AMP phosphodiesterase CpdA
MSNRLALADQAGPAEEPAPPQAPAGHTTIIQISDVHLLAEGLQHGCVDTLANLDLVLQRIERSGLRPDLLLLTGDLTDKGEAAAYRALRRRVEQSVALLGSDVMYLPGNHDLREALRAELLDEPPTGEPIDQVVSVGGVRVVGLDSVVPGADGGELRPGQLEWLAGVLAEPAPAGTVVALHHPPLPSPIASMSRIALRNPEQLSEVVEGTDVSVILAGHNHHPMSGMLGTVPVWLCPATAYQADPLVPDGRFRGYPGAACSRIDLWPGRVLATTIIVGGGPEPIVDVPMSAMPMR